VYVCLHVCVRECLWKFLSDIFNSRTRTAQDLYCRWDEYADAVDVSAGSSHFLRAAQLDDHAARRRFTAATAAADYAALSADGVAAASGTDIVVGYLDAAGQVLQPAAESVPVSSSTSGSLDSNQGQDLGAPPGAVAVITTRRA
jgi:hypothetical protein